jgi:hypothetical protein
MGDMADFTNERCERELDELYEHCENGFETSQEAYDKGMINELGGDTFTDESFVLPRRSRPCFVTVPLQKKFVPCKYCGFAKLVWKNTDEGWRLAHSDGELHACEERMEATAWE